VPWLNGERALTGMTATKVDGRASRPGTILHDWNDIRRPGHSHRPVHYPQHPTCWTTPTATECYSPEIPMWQFSKKQMSNPNMLTLAKTMIKKMIEQTGNHPSVFA
jgi:hypothetical protein